MHRTVCTVIVTLIAMLASASAHTAGAQEAAVAPVACTYATCALRLSRGRLVRGPTSDRVGKRLNGLGGGVDLLLSGPDSAATYARSYVGNSRKAAGFALAALTGYLIGLNRTSNFASGQDPTVGTVLVLGGSLVSAITATVFEGRGGEDLSRSVWWYNAALPK